MIPGREDAYRRLQHGLENAARPAGLVRRQEHFVEHAWRHLESTGVSWLGFYSIDPDDPEAMVLGPRRDRPACSPIGLHGVCGQALVGGVTRIVGDVEELGADYVACDPRDRSEIVIPLRLESRGGRPFDSVLDLDSFELNSFSDADDRWLRACLASAGLVSSETPVPGSANT